MASTENPCDIVVTFLEFACHIAVFSRRKFKILSFLNGGDRCVGERINLNHVSEQTAINALTKMTDFTNGRDHRRVSCGFRMRP